MPPEMIEPRKFKFHWLIGKVEVGEGYGISDAFKHLGYGGGTIRTLDYYEEVTIPQKPS